MPGIVLFGYSDVGYECLDLLVGQGRDVRLVVTHEDSPSEAKWFRSVRERASAASIETTTAELKDDPSIEARIAGLAPDLILSCYYRRMIPARILDHARLGAFNMHGSLLPQYRGRAPVNWAILHGETQVGATLHRMVKRADAGDIVDAEAVSVGLEETAFEAMGKVVGAARRTRRKRHISAAARPKTGASIGLGQRRASSISCALWQPHFRALLAMDPAGACSCGVPAKRRERACRARF